MLMALSEIYETCEQRLPKVYIQEMRNIRTTRELESLLKNIREFVNEELRIQNGGFRKMICWKEKRP